MNHNDPNAASYRDRYLLQNINTHNYHEITVTVAISYAVRAAFTRVITVWGINIFITVIITTDAAVIPPENIATTSH